MNDRIKAIRKHYKLTQTEFGERIKVTQGGIASYESGARTPLDAIVDAICKQYRVNEEWLRTGRGEMLIADSREEEISKFFSSVMSEESDFRRRFIAALAKLDEREWELIENMAHKIANEQ